MRPGQGSVKKLNSVSEFCQPRWYWILEQVGIHHRQGLINSDMCYSMTGPFRQIYQKLLNHYGPQHWWPADDPFEVMVGAVLTQNTAWGNVEKAIRQLKQARLLTAQAIVTADTLQLAECLRPSGYFNIKAKRLQNLCRWFVAQGEFPVLQTLSTAELRHSLLSVNGVGPETADDILLYAFERSVFVIDAYTRRIFARQGLIAGDEGYETLRHMLEHALDLDVAMFNEYHALIVQHAKQHCKKTPRCGACCIKRSCVSAETYSATQD